MSSEDVISLEISLVNLVNKCYPDRIDYVDKVLSNTNDIFNKLNIGKVDYNSPLSRELTRLMKIPVEFYNNILTVLKLEHYRPLLEHFDYLGNFIRFYYNLKVFHLGKSHCNFIITGRKSLAVYIVTNILDNDTLISTPETVDMVLSMLAPLIQDQSDQPNMEDDPEDFDEEQGLLGR